MNDNEDDQLEHARLTELFDLGDIIIDAGFDVFPAAVWVQDDGTVKKAPLMPHGHLDAHRDRQLLRQQIINPYRPPQVPADYEVVVAFVPGSGGCGVLDCDVKHGAQGKQALADLTRQYEPFYKAVWNSPSGGANILFDKPPSAAYSNRSPWPGIDVRADNGWVVAPGNRCAAGTWEWKVGGFTTAARLPEGMSQQLTPANLHGRKASNSETVAFIEASPPNMGLPVMEAFGRELARFQQAGTGSRHDALLRIAAWTCGMEALDLRWAVERIKDEWLVLTAGEGREDEVTEVLTWVVGQETVKRQQPATQPDPLIGVYQPTASRVVDGAVFVLDDAVDLVARWGDGGDVLWAQGESLMICGPTGVGKTTLAGQIVGGLIGVLPDVLGYPVLAADRVLYLAMDRPKQIRRAFGRLFTKAHRGALQDRLAVRPGPLPQDLANRPEQLLELAQEHGCDVVVLDSLKDAAVAVHDPTVGGQINRAVQWCNAANIDVLMLHHQRKSQDGRKPSKLDDVYGGMPVTAGAGSVLLLWGEAGSELVELSHLKQPAETIGPLSVEHDHHKGTSTVTRSWDALAWLTNRGKTGGTIDDAAKAAYPGTTPTAAERKKVERRLRKLEDNGTATRRASAGPGQPATFHAVFPQGSPQAAANGSAVTSAGHGQTGQEADTEGMSADDAVESLAAHGLNADTSTDT